jgi:hypothetical protein
MPPDCAVELIEFALVAQSHLNDLSVPAAYQVGPDCPAGVPGGIQPRSDFNCYVPEPHAA